MRTWGLGCPCGAWVQGSRKAVNAWSDRHECPPAPEHMQRLEHGGSLIENAARYEMDGLEARIGFQRNT